MRAFFLSDLHLQNGEDPASRRLESFLTEIPQKDDLVIFGGDIFDLFVGDKEVFRKKFAGVLAESGRSPSGEERCFTWKATTISISAPYSRACRE